MALPRYVPVLATVLLLVSGVVTPVRAQDGVPSVHTNRPIPYPVVPPPAFRRAVERGTRTLSGEPGPRYWQQWADYQIDAELDPTSKSVRGSIDIVYQNNSPDTLAEVFLHLHQNLHAPGAIRNRVAEVTGGVRLRRVSANGADLRNGLGYAVRNTILRVRPRTPVRPGGSVDLHLEWEFTVPASGVGRMGWNHDDLFFIAYWYPQMAVYDDLDGWQLDPYLGDSEFYAGYGNYDFSITVPEGWVVQGTGALQNPEAVLQPPILARLARARASDDRVAIVTEEDLDRGRVTQRGNGGKLTWRFRADRVRDVAFTAVRRSRWDAARTPVGDRDGDGTVDYALVQSIYRPSARLWSHAWRYAQHSIDFLSRWTGVPYPWPHMTSVEGGGIIGGGMEFPMMTLIGNYSGRTDTALYNVHAHELAHMWVPMIVGVDERRRAWMDEGTTTFNENQARKEFYPGVDHDQGDRESYLAVARAGLEGEMMRRTDYHYSDAARGTASYSKPASVLAALRGLLGEETFVAAYRSYLSSWSYKHPQPWDFFNTFDRVAGRDLGWFWRSWYYETWTLDQAVGAVEQGPTGIHITIEDRGNVPMPARVAVVLDGGEMIFREVPVERWLDGARTAVLTLDVTGPVRSVEIDPEGVFPDIDRTNNVWRR